MAQDFGSDLAWQARCDLEQPAHPTDDANHLAQCHEEANVAAEAACVHLRKPLRDRIIARRVEVDGVSDVIRDWGSWEPSFVRYDVPDMRVSIRK